jgi:arylsulfatase A-like enzyme
MIQELKRPLMLGIAVLLGNLWLGPRAGAEDGSSQTNPNVIFILSDDQGWADIGYNNPSVYSPNLDQLAREGITFARNYVMPQCTPTRVALMTGRYPSRFGGAALQASNAPPIPLGTPTLATVFQDSGYTTHLAGKWHLGSDLDHGPNHFGFDSSYGSLTGAVGMYDHRYRQGKFEKTWHRDHKLIEGSENGTHATDLVTREAIRVIESDHDKPFFLYLPFHSIHTPLDERGRFVDRPTQLDPEKPDRWLDEDEIEWFNDPNGIIQKESDPEKRLLLAAIHHLDSSVGLVVDALTRTGQRHDTLIIFSSDNGPQGSWPGNAYPDDLKLTDFNQPLPVRGKKLDVWEGGIHVPGFINWPDHIPPATINTPIHIVDWLPTLAEQIGSSPAYANDWDGMNLKPLFEGQSLPTRDLYWTWSQTPNRWALRFEDWKIVNYGRPKPSNESDWQLFNLTTDPRESKDVKDEHPMVLSALHQRFIEQQTKDAPSK